MYGGVFDWFDFTANIVFCFLLDVVVDVKKQALSSS